MVRIRGHIGELPVDLSIEMDEQDWVQLTRQLRAAPDAGQEASVATSAAPDPFWSGAQQLLREAGQIDGPQLLAELHALSGSTQVAKRLLVRLRHSAQVKVHNGPDAPIYSWID